MSFEYLPTIATMKEQMEKYKTLLNNSLINSLPNIEEDKLMSDLLVLENNLHKQLSDADKYNKKFSEHGWIVHETLDTETLINAVEKYESEGIDEAEKIILSYYKDIFSTMKNRIFNSKYFKSRKRIFELAYTDFIEERYYSSIPVILMMIDGVLNDLKLKGFSASKEDYEVWDGISGHSSGLNQIHKIYTKSIKKTLVDDTVLPHRHGILHGRILNYDNEKLAVKCLALIIYIFDWIQSFTTEEYRKNEYLEEKNHYLFMENIAIHQNEREFQEKWAENQEKVINYNKTDLEKLDKGTPEFHFMTFIHNLNNKRYDLNYNYLPIEEREGHTKGHLAGQIKQEFEDFLPITVENLHVNNRGSATSTLNANLTYTSIVESKENVECEVTVLMAYQNTAGASENRLTGEGQWVIMQMF